MRGFNFVDKIRSINQRDPAKNAEKEKQVLC